VTNLLLKIKLFPKCHPNSLNFFSFAILPKHLAHFGTRFNSVVFALVDELYNQKIEKIHPQN